jgi:lysozyme
MTPVEIAALIAEPFEGFKSYPYLCPAGIPTIGIGTTRYPNDKRVTLKDSPVTYSQAKEFMYYELEQCQKGVLRCCPMLSGNTLGAIIDFTYNLGVGRLQASTLKRRLNEQDIESAKQELLKWVWAGGRKLNGLVARRKIESIYLT